METRGVPSMGPKSDLWEPCVLVVVGRLSVTVPGGCGGLPSDTHVRPRDIAVGGVLRKPWVLATEAGVLLAVGPLNISHG